MSIARRSRLDGRSHPRRAALLAARGLPALYYKSLTSGAQKGRRWAVTGDVTQFPGRREADRRATGSDSPRSVRRTRRCRPPIRPALPANSSDASPGRRATRTPRAGSLTRREPVSFGRRMRRPDPNRLERAREPPGRTPGGLRAIARYQLVDAATRPRRVPAVRESRRGCRRGRSRRTGCRA